MKLTPLTVSAAAWKQETCWPCRRSNTCTARHDMAQHGMAWHNCNGSTRNTCEHTSSEGQKQKEGQKHKASNRNINSVACAWTGKGSGCNVALAQLWSPASMVCAAGRVWTHPNTAVTAAGSQVAPACLYAEPYPLVGSAGRPLHAAHNLRGSNTIRVLIAWPGVVGNHGGGKLHASQDLTHSHSQLDPDKHIILLNKTAQLT